ncbi:MAG: hypothetical protein AAFZ80_13035, partial [Cyanobacteria bacterium P01_A01_bin.105]
LPPVPATGRAMKALEDRLDSLICAYVAAHYWWWGQARNQVLGSLADGYIVVPCPVFSRVRHHSGETTLSESPAESAAARS